MTGQYTCRSPRLYSLNWTCRKLARSLEFSIEHIARDQNIEANDLANSGRSLPPACMIRDSYDLVEQQSTRPRGQLAFPIC